MRALRVVVGCTLALVGVGAPASGQVPPPTPPPTATAPPPAARPPRLPPLVTARLPGGYRRWQTSAQWPQYVAPPDPLLLTQVPVAVPKALMGSGRNRVIRISFLGQVFLPSCSSECTPGEMLLGRTMGARVSAFLVRGPCPATPPRPSSQRIPLVKSRGVILDPERPYADLTPGVYRAIVTVPVAGMAPGTYTTCTWADARADSPVSNPYTDLNIDADGTLGARPERYFGLMGPGTGGRLVRITR